MGAENKTQHRVHKRENGDKPYPLIFTQARAIGVSEFLTTIVNHDIRMGRDTEQRNPESNFDEFLGKIVAGTSRSQGALVFVDRNLITEVKRRLWTYLAETQTNPTVDKIGISMVGIMASLDVAFAGVSGEPAIPQRRNMTNGRVTQRILGIRVK